MARWELNALREAILFIALFTLMAGSKGGNYINISRGEIDGCEIIWTK